MENLQRGAVVSHQHFTFSYYLLFDADLKMMSIEFQAHFVSFFSQFDSYKKFSIPIIGKGRF